MIKIAVVEDEQMFVSQLTAYLLAYQRETGEELEVKVYQDGDGIVSDYHMQFDLILMDIQMKFVDGMSAASEIRSVDSEVAIMFITNTPQYAIRGYEVGALDYILKPVSYFAFSQKLGKALARLRRREHRYLTIPVKGGFLRMDAADIYFVESCGHNLIYHTAKGEYVSSGTMKSAEAQLHAFDFARANKCYLINLRHVEGIQEKCAVVKGHRLQVSRPKMNVFMQELTRYWGGTGGGNGL